MALIYDLNPQRSTGKVSIKRMDATRKYLTHYENLLKLQFIAMNTKERAEKQEAIAEMAIAERKLAFWRRQENFDQAEALNGCRKLKREWRSPVH